MLFPSYKNELEYLKKGYDLIVGCDEVGAGPVAGPVVSAACVIDPSCIGDYRSKNKWYYRVRDSKTVNENEREALVKEIISHCVTYGVGEVWPDEIDRINIHQAKLLSTKKAIQQLFEKLSGREAAKAMVFIDGIFTIKSLDLPLFNVEQKAVIGGDAKILSISAASIIAKVHRDRILKEYDLKMPEYGFAKHKGYNTKEHQKAIMTHGISDFHRKSFLKNLI